MRSTTAARRDPGSVAFLCLAAWAVPGVGHVLVHQRRKGLVFLVALVVMFAIGVALQGRLFSVDFGDPLGTLAFLADLGVGVPFIVARALGYGPGQVTAATFEYGNTFLIVAGLLNVLVVLDAVDIALGRKQAGPTPAAPAASRRS